MARVNEIAAQVMEHLCTCPEHGYSQYGRWGGGGYCNVATDIGLLSVKKGDRDCSSAVIDSWRKALQGTSYEGELDDATYTGNMKRVFTRSGLFEWKPMSFSASRGDVYLNEAYHTAMCIHGESWNDVLGEFSISETGDIDGEPGDQTGWESSIHGYYDYPWDGILHYNGKADYDSPVPQPAENIRYRVSVDVDGNDWCDEMVGLSDTGDSGDDYAGIMGKPVLWLSCQAPKYRVFTEGADDWLEWVDMYDSNDLEYGTAGDGTPILLLEIPDENIRYQVHTIKDGWLPWMKGHEDTGGSWDFFAGNYNVIDAVRMEYA